MGLVWGPDGLDGPVTFFFSLYKALRYGCTEYVHILSKLYRKLKLFKPAFK